MSCWHGSSEPWPWALPQPRQTPEAACKNTTFPRPVSKVCMLMYKRGPQASDCERSSECPCPKALPKEGDAQHLEGRGPSPGSCKWKIGPSKSFSSHLCCPCAKVRCLSFAGHARSAGPDGRVRATPGGLALRLVSLPRGNQRNHQQGKDESPRYLRAPQSSRLVYWLRALLQSSLQTGTRKV